MNETTKTLSFIAVGGILAACATVVHFTSQPKSMEEFALVGTEFYPDFSEPQKAKFLEVAAYDEEKGEANTFRVEQKDGVWRIPSHHDYPAEAKDRLVETATSVIGIERKALAGRRAADHKKFGVIDPLAEEISDPDAVGKRVKLGVADDDVLADYIVGFQVEESEITDNPELRQIRGEKQREPLFYVRRPDEKETYIANLSIDVSTKFSDWIEPDLLKLEESDVRELVIDKYSIEYKEEQVRQGPLVMLTQVPVKSDTESHRLSREGGFGPWKLEGIDEEAEELESTKISDLTSSLAGLEILGVRPRYQYDGKSLLNAKLEIDLPKQLLEQGRDAVQEEMSQVQSDLGDHGFSIDVDQSGDKPIIKLLSDKGELSVGTEAGLVYHLHFGSMFLGSDAEIEFGGDKKTTKADSDPADENKSTEDKASADDEKSADDETESDQKKSRFLLVRVQHDPARVEGKPTEPTAPTEPAKPSADDKQEPPTKPPVKTPDDPTGETSGKAEDTTSESSDDASEESDTETDGESSCDFSADQDDAEQDDAKDEDGAKPDQPEAEPSAVDKPGESKQLESGAGDAKDDDAKESDSGTPEETAKPDPAAEYEAAMKQYAADKQQYTINLEQYKNALQEHQKKVADSKSRTDELNERFADWYYVISAEDLENLRLSRSDLVKPKEKPEEEKTPEVGKEGFDPGKLLPDLSGENQSSETESAPEEDSTSEEKE